MQKDTSRAEKLACEILGDDVLLFCMCVYLCIVQLHCVCVCVSTKKFSFIKCPRVQQNAQKQSVYMCVCLSVISNMAVS